MAKGKRAGARPKRRFDPSVLAIGAGMALTVAAWAYLVWAAIEFGTKARGGAPHAWAYLALAGIGAMACLFTALLLGARLVAAFATPTAPLPPPTATQGGRRRME